MDNKLSKGLLIAAAVGLVNYGLVALKQSFWQGIVALVLGVLLFVGREVLKQYNFNLKETAIGMKNGVKKVVKKK